MAGHPKDRQRSATDVSLLLRASTVRLFPPLDRAVFYAENDGARTAAQFVSQGNGFTRLDELLQQSAEGRAIWQALTKAGNPWSSTQEVWWELSWRLARAARGVVNVFGPARLIEDRPLSEFKHKYTTGAYANTIFEKVELPELEQNPNVTAIYYNGKAF